MTDPHTPHDEFPDPLPVPVIGPGIDPARVVIRPPGSKSITNRALLLAALARGTSTLINTLTDADDAQRMLAAINTLGARLVHTADGALQIRGVGGVWRQSKDGTRLNLGNAGTATRFLTAAALLGDADRGPIIIDGNERMRQRPIGELVEALRSIGARVEYDDAEGCPPLRVYPLGSPTVSEVSFGRTASGQFVSAMLLTAPFLESGLTLRFTEPPTSAAYIDMTLAVLREAGAAVSGAPPSDTTVEGGGLDAFEVEIEPDASGAVPFWCAAALINGLTVRTPGLHFTSTQSDARVPMLLRQMGASIAFDAGGAAVTGTGTLAPLDADLSAMPDSAMSLAAVACFADGPSTLRGLRTLRVKETDRIAALQTELARLGVSVEPFSTPDGDEAIRITPPDKPIDASARVKRIVFETYDDHRMAMSMALIGLRRPNVHIADPGCVDKTYPGFWDDFAAIIEAAE